MCKIQQVCEVCMEDYTHGSESPRRPIVLQCGHSVCHHCFVELTCCHLCKKSNSPQLQNKHKLKGSVNYAIEQSCTPESMLDTKKEDEENIQGVHYCFDCKLIYKPVVKVSFLDDDHKSHKVVPLYGKDIDLAKSFLWIKQNKNISLEGTGPLCGFLRQSVAILQGLIADSDNLRMFRGSESQTGFDDMIRTMMLEGKDYPGIPYKEQLDSYLRIRLIQQKLGVAMLEFANECDYQFQFKPAQLEASSVKDVPRVMLKPNLVPLIQTPLLNPKGRVGLIDYFSTQLKPKFENLQQTIDEFGRPVSFENLGKRQRIHHE